MVGEDAFFIASWQLFLTGVFSIPPIDIVAGQPQRYALRSSADFRSVFPPALALVIILVGLLSLHLIAKSLIPLNQLKLLAQQYAAGKLKSRIRLRTGDEFQALGETFNKMARQLSMQIDTLKAMSEIDRLILEGAEALLRWPHSSKGPVSPTEFIPLAEDIGLINEIGKWVLLETCRNLRSILDRGLHPGPVSINVSGLQLREYLCDYHQDGA